MLSGSTVIFCEIYQKKAERGGWIEFIYQSLKLQAKAPIQMVGKGDEPACFLGLYRPIFRGKLAVIVENGI